MQGVSRRARLRLHVAGASAFAFAAGVVCATVFAELMPRKDVVAARTTIAAPSVSANSKVQAVMVGYNGIGYPPRRLSDDTGFYEWLQDAANGG